METSMEKLTTVYEITTAPNIGERCLALASEVSLRKMQNKVRVYNEDGFGAKLNIHHFDTPEHAKAFVETGFHPVRV